MDSGAVWAFVVIGVFVVFCIFGFVRARKKQQAEKADVAARGATVSMMMDHVMGLPVAQGAEVKLYDTPTQFVITRNGEEWTLKKDRIQDLTWASGSQLKHMIGGGGLDAGQVAAGYLVAGLAGVALAAIASTAQYLVIVYRDSDDKTLKTILLKAKPYQEAAQKKIQKEFESTRKPSDGPKEI